MVKKLKRKAARRQAQYYRRKKHGGAVLPTHIGNLVDLELLLRDSGLIPDFIEEPRRDELATALSLYVARALTRHRAACSDMA